MAVFRKSLAENPSDRCLCVARPKGKNSVSTPYWSQSICNTKDLPPQPRRELLLGTPTKTNETTLSNKNINRPGTAAEKSITYRQIYDESLMNTICYVVQKSLILCIKIYR